ncbi:MAG: ComF family protein [Burkholderiales bacterium]|nr:ComF family protein [Burkholderiales bacterium]
MPPLPIPTGQDCILCGGPAGARALCEPCVRSLPLLPPHCPRCALPCPAAVPCGSCLRRAPCFDRTVAIWAYAFPLDRLIGALKFRHRLHLADFFAASLAQRIAERPGLLVALPLHRSRLAHRGFNQSQEIARRLARDLRIPLATRGLERCRATAAQSALPLRERVRNVRGAFRCRLDLRGTTVGVVDDVMTTGATLDEFADCLKRSGAESVTNLVLARTPSLTDP